MESPYKNISIEKWEGITRELILSHPLESKEIIDAVLESWNSIFESS